MSKLNKTIPRKKQKASRVVEWIINFERKRRVGGRGRHRWKEKFVLFEKKKTNV